MEICLKKNKDTIVSKFTIGDLEQLSQAMKVHGFLGTVANPIPINKFLDKESSVEVPKFNPGDSLAMEINENKNQLDSTIDPEFHFFELINMSEEFNKNYGQGNNTWGAIFELSEDWVAAPNGSLFIKPIGELDGISYSQAVVSEANENFSVIRTSFVLYRLVFTLNINLNYGTDDVENYQKCTFIIDPVIDVSSTTDPTFP